MFQFNETRGKVVKYLRRRIGIFEVSRLEMLDFHGCFSIFGKSSSSGYTRSRTTHQDRNWATALFKRKRPASRDEHYASAATAGCNDTLKTDGRILLAEMSEPLALKRERNHRSQI